MASKTTLGLGFRFVAAAALIAGASQLLSVGSEPATAETEGIVAQIELPPAAEAPADDMVTPASFTETDEEPGFRITHPLTVDGEMQFGEYAWNDEGVPEGELRIIVDLQAERLFAYRGGYEIGRAVILYGHDDTPTPTGRFTITEKNRDHISNLYFVPMPFMMRLTNDGIAIHGSLVEEGFASRGCVGIPDDFAELLFNEAEIGTPVLISRGSPIVDGNRVVGI
ncbi:L,D-transpeptidase family protein [Parasphingopyxis sp.]|uniref:L,D-transpeptidase family protein n=1 Tax=Parasphingopyxis sp. TaxID=1920299 RepID=UPI00263211A6|nr:L,D-transpeptidase family protein [Parasphingopyxis sp.]